jgi:hypothetical protein
MALLEDVLGIIFIVFFMIIAIVFISTALVTDQTLSIEKEQQDYLFDYYSTSVNSFMNLRDQFSNVPVHIIIGNYIGRGERVVLGDNGTSLNVTDLLEDLLDNFFGKDNYYAEIRQDYTNTTLSFVFDGSDSNRKEKIIIGERLQDILDSVNAIFEGYGVSATANLYVLSERQEIEACKDFGNHSDTCTIINSSAIYGDDSSPIVERPIRHSLTNYRALDSHYLESDWLGGIVHAEKLFRRELIGVDEREEDVHIVIPVFDQLSSSSISDDCFHIASTENLGNYVICRLCHPECPTNRTEAQLNTTVNYFLERNRNSLVLPVFSFTCNFRYFYDWNGINPRDPFDQFMPPSIASGETICHYDGCTGCSPASGNDFIPSTNNTLYQNVCFKDYCQEAIWNQMNRIAEPTGGSPVNIANTNEIASQITENLENAFEMRKLIIGEKYPQRTRYVFETSITLPNLGKAEVYLQVYETPLQN